MCRRVVPEEPTGGRAAQPADEFCAAIPGGVGLSAAAVHRCGLPGVRGEPAGDAGDVGEGIRVAGPVAVSASSYDAAWGWHCPDTGPGGSANCDPAYAGFVNQAYGMAKQWSRYRVHPEQYRYRAGETVDILWNVVESGCGGAPVTIANTATASLYNYTPYQPNAAALAAYPGVGDACSAYGNRNFFFLFNRYFGSTGGGNTGIGWARPRSPPRGGDAGGGAGTGQRVRGRWVGRPVDHGAVPRGGSGFAGRVRGAGVAVRVGRRRVRGGPEQRLRAGRRAVQQLRHRDRVRLLRVDRVRAGPGRVHHPRRFVRRSAGPVSRCPGIGRCPVTSSATRATSRSTWASPTASGTSWRRPGWVPRCTSCRSPAPMPTPPSTATGRRRRGVGRLRRTRPQPSPYVRAQPGAAARPGRRCPNGQPGATGDANRGRAVRLAGVRLVQRSGSDPSSGSPAPSASSSTSRRSRPDPRRSTRPVARHRVHQHSDRPEPAPPRRPDHAPGRPRDRHDGAHRRRPHRHSDHGNGHQSPGHQRPDDRDVHRAIDRNQQPFRNHAPGTPRPRRPTTQRPTTSAIHRDVDTAPADHPGDLPADNPEVTAAPTPTLPPPTVAARAPRPARRSRRRAPRQLTTFAALIESLTDDPCG